MIRLLLAGSGALIAGWFLLRARSVEQRLHELGVVKVPKRLEARRAREESDAARFLFERDAGSFWLVGAPDTSCERLVIGVWTPGAHAEARKNTIWLAEDSMAEELVRWREEDGFSIGEGMYRTGVDERPSWVVVKEDAARQVTVAYMVWKKEGSLRAARKIVQEAVESYRPAMGVEEYLPLAVDRPGKLRAAQREAARQWLAAQGIALEVDGPVVEKDGVVYGLYRTEQWGVQYVAMTALGDLPAAPRYQASGQYGGMVLWFTKDGAEWQAHGVHGERPYLPGRLGEYLDGAAKAGRANFYAARIELWDDVEGTPLDAGQAAREAKEVRRRFDGGEWVKVWE